jgi:hypothetical protein
VESRRKPGPKPKGERSQITLRVPAEHRVIYALTAAAKGLPLNDYLVSVLARAHDLPVPVEAPAVDPGRQKGTPLNRTA